MVYERRAMGGGREEAVPAPEEWWPTPEEVKTLQKQSVREWFRPYEQWHESPKVDWDAQDYPSGTWKQFQLYKSEWWPREDPEHNEFRRAEQEQRFQRAFDDENLIGPVAIRADWADAPMGGMYDEDYNGMPRQCVLDATTHPLSNARRLVLPVPYGTLEVELDCSNSGSGIYISEMTNSYIYDPTIESWLLNRKKAYFYTLIERKVARWRHRMNSIDWMFDGEYFANSFSDDYHLPKEVSYLLSEAIAMAASPPVSVYSLMRHEMSMEIDPERPPVWPAYHTPGRPAGIPDPKSFGGVTWRVQSTTPSSNATVFRWGPRTRAEELQQEPGEYYDTRRIHNRLLYTLRGQLPDPYVAPELGNALLHVFFNRKNGTHPTIFKLFITETCNLWEALRGRLRTKLASMRAAVDLQQQAAERSYAPGGRGYLEARDHFQALQQGVGVAKREREGEPGTPPPGSVQRTRAWLGRLPSLAGLRL